MSLIWVGQNCLGLLNTFLCIISVLLFIKGRRWEKNGTRETDKKAEVICFLLLMFLAAAVRLWKFGVVPSGMNQDGAMAAVDAKALADHATDRFGMKFPVHFTAWGYGQMSVLLSYCMIPFIKAFGLSALTARLPILLFSVAGLAVLYGIARKLWGRDAALLTLAFAACNPWHFIQSRWALDCNMFPHVFLIAFFLLLLGMEGKKAYLYLSMFFFSLCMYAYGIAFYTVPVFLIGMAIYLGLKKITPWKDILICISIYAVFSLPIYLTMMINAFGWDTIRTPFCTMPYFPQSIRSGDIIFFARDKRKQVLANLASLVSVYLKGDSLPWNTVNGFGAVTACFLPFAALGLGCLIVDFRKEKDDVKRAACFALFLYFIVANLSGIITAYVNVNRVNLLFYALILLIGYGMEFVRCGIRKLSWVALAGYLLVSVLFFQTYFTTHAQSLSHYYFEGFLSAVQFAGEQTSCTKYCITPEVKSGDVAANTAEILTMFALKLDAEFYQGKSLDENGLSYCEKFSYRMVKEGETLHPSTVYVITKKDAQRAIWQDCALYPCKDYYVAVPLP